MATSPATIAFLLDQLAAIEQVAARRMFGEYGLSVAGKPVGVVCDDQLFLKPTSAARQLLASPVEAAPYPGAKAHLLITADLWEDAEWLCRLLRATAAELPAAAPRKTKR